MGKNEQQSEPPQPEAGSAASNLDGITQDIEHLRQTVVAQLARDLRHLQGRKIRLQREVAALERQQHQQIVQQQKLIRQIAPTLVDELASLLQQQLQQARVEATSLNEDRERTYKLVASLDSTLRSVFQALEQDISSYQSSLYHRLNQMHSLEQQGEVLLDVLVQRLQAQLSHPSLNPPQSQSSTATASQSFPRIVRQPKATGCKLRLGFVFVLLCALTLSFYNVVVAVMLNGTSGQSIVAVEPVLPLSLGNVLLMLGLRLLVVVPLLTGLTSMLYPKIWQALLSTFERNKRQLWLPVIGSGFFLFLSQVLIYLAFGSELSPGEVVTLFFIFPAVTVLFSWLLFTQPPQGLRGIASLVVISGVVISFLATSDGIGDFSWFGRVTAVSAGITFAFYVLLTKVCTKQLHPVPLSLINFWTMLVLSGLSFLFPPVHESVRVASGNWFSLSVGGLLLGGLTLLSYLLNHIGMSSVGATRASIFGALGPGLTAMLAWLFMGATLSLGSFWGMMIVTMGVLVLSWERWHHHFPSRAVL